MHSYFLKYWNMYISLFDNRSDNNIYNNPYTAFIAMLVSLILIISTLAIMYLIFLVYGLLTFGIVFSNNSNFYTGCHYNDSYCANNYNLTGGYCGTQHDCNYISMPLICSNKDLWQGCFILGILGILVTLISAILVFGITIFALATHHMIFHKTQQLTHGETVNNNDNFLVNLEDVSEQI